MAGRFVSVPMTLSDLERPMRGIIFFRWILITLVRSATSLHLHKCVARFVSDSGVSCEIRPIRSLSLLTYLFPLANIVDADASVS